MNALQGNLLKGRLTLDALTQLCRPSQGSSADGRGCSLSSEGSAGCSQLVQRTASRPGPQGQGLRPCHGRKSKTPRDETIRKGLPGT